jgi:hypothetical protein
MIPRSVAVAVRFGAIVFWQRRSPRRKPQSPSRVSFFPYNPSQKQSKLINSQHRNTRRSKRTAIDYSSERGSEDPKAFPHSRQLHSIQFTLGWFISYSAIYWTQITKIRTRKAAQETTHDLMRPTRAHLHHLHRATAPASAQRKRLPIRVSEESQA